MRFGLNILFTSIFVDCNCCLSFLLISGIGRIDVVGEGTDTRPPVPPVILPPPFCIVLGLFTNEID